MPACPNGAQPNPASAGLQVWIDKAKLPAAVIGLFEVLSPLGLAAIATQLTDVNALCAENPDVPPPFEISDFVDQSTWGGPLGQIVKPQAVIKAYQWLRYGEFLINCQCAAPQPPAGLACPWTLANFSLPSNGSSAAVAYEIPQSAYDSWPVSDLGPNPDWEPVWSMAFSSHSPATTQRFVEWSSDGTTWHPFVELFNTPTANAACHASPTFLPAPKMPRTGLVRIHNNSASTLTLSGFSFCLCGLTTTPPVLPPQPPITTAPPPPTTVCSTDDLCLMTAELLVHVERLALQVSDLEAGLLSRGTLTEISRQTITGEGEATLVLGTRAVSLELTALSSDAFTSALGRPRGLMRVGSIRYGDGIGYSPRRFIDADRFDDPLPAGALTISWQLLPPAVAVLKFLG